MNIEELYAIYEKYPKIITDSRKATAGSIFFALKGENFDGNNFAKDALNICQYAVVDNPDVAINERYILMYFIRCKILQFITENNLIFQL